MADHAQGQVTSRKNVFLPWTKRDEPLDEALDVKTLRLYVSWMRLLNVRLNEEDAQFVRRLRDRGVSISELVRGAIRGEAKTLATKAPPDADALLAEIRRQYPMPATVRRIPRVDTTQRKQVQALIREKLRGRP